MRREGQGENLKSEISNDLEGNFDVGFRPDKEILNAVNAPNVYTGEIQNRENIGKTSADLIAQWNAAHPDDPVA